MPVVMIYGLCGKTKSIPNFREQLKKVISTISALELDPKGITVLTLGQKVPDNDEDIIVEVKGLFANAKRTVEVQNLLARQIRETITSFVNNREPPFSKAAPLIKVFIYTFDPAHQGFASNAPPKQLVH